MTVTVKVPLAPCATVSVVGVALSVKLADAVPVPLSVTVWVLGTAASARTRLAVSAAATVGLKTTLTVHEALAAMLVPHVLVAVKSVLAVAGEPPETVALVNAIAALCTSAMVLSQGASIYFSHNIQEALRQYISPMVNAHTVDLTNHSGRSGKEPVFQEIAIYDENNERSQCLMPGTNITVEMKVKRTEKINSPKVAIGVTNMRGERVFAIGTHMGGSEIPPIEGTATVRAQFTLPFLVAGQYAVDLGFYDRNHNAFDEIHGAITFEVLKDNYLTMIENWGHHMGNIMVRSDWQCIHDTDKNSAELISTDGQK